MFAVGGIDKEGSIEFYTMNNDPKDEFKSFSPIGDTISYAFLSSSVVNDEIVYNTFIENLRQTGFNTSNKCLKAQKMLNSFVETIDPTVNKRTFELTIKK